MHVLSSSTPPFLQVLVTALKIFAYTLAAPFLLVAVLSAFACAMLDFAWFRTRHMLLGNPQPKRLWEF